MKKNIIFIDVLNSCHSQIAEAFAKEYGSEKINVFSAGSHPADEMDKTAIEVMKEDGYNLKTQSPKLTISLEDINFDFAIKINCGNDCPYVISRYHEDWKIIIPSKNDKEEYRKMVDEIKERVINFLKQFE